MNFQILVLWVWTEASSFCALDNLSSDNDDTGHGWGLTTVSIVFKYNNSQESAL